VTFAHLSPVVYLDTQDYSCVGKVLQGAGNTHDESLFLELTRRREAGDVIFAYSATILSELLQYDERFVETSVCKAEAIEQLCGSYALAFPSRLLALQIANVATHAGLLSEAPTSDVLSDAHYWFPNVADVLENMAARLRMELESQLDSTALLNRQARRAAKRQARGKRMIDVVRAAVPEFAAEYRVSEEAVTSSVIALLEGRISPDEASRRLFASLASPVAFIRTYFQMSHGDKSLPRWIGDLGHAFERVLRSLKSGYAPFLHDPKLEAQAKKQLPDLAKRFSMTSLELARPACSEFHVSDALLDRFKTDKELALRVPALTAFAPILEAYIAETSGFAGQTAGIEHGFAGDLMHSMYLKYVDLWRGDRRFAHLARANVPEHKSKIIRLRSELPAAIDRFNRERERRGR
jgi:hypothetical protein